MWTAKNILGFDFAKGSGGVSGYVKALFIEPDLVSWLCVVLVSGVGIALALLISISPTYKNTSTEQP